MSILALPVTQSSSRGRGATASSRPVSTTRTSRVVNEPWEEIESGTLIRPSERRERFSGSAVVSLDWHQVLALNVTHEVLIAHRLHTHCFLNTSHSSEA